MKVFEAGGVAVGREFFVIAGPCAAESETLCMETAEAIRNICAESGAPFIFKSSYLKDNRTSFSSYSGPGIEKGLEILKKVKYELGVPVLTDVHCTREVDACAGVADILQIPALLSRQSRLIMKAAATGLPVNVKKGQFMSPWDAVNIIRKIEKAGGTKIIITERGTTFGYNNLVVDMRAFPVMREFGYPVVFDATHSVQRPGGMGDASGGERMFVEPLSLAAAGAGCDGIFLEVHPEPDKALCDGPNMLSIRGFEKLLPGVAAIASLVRG